MDISLAWLNRYLDHPVHAEEAERLLTFAGFPFDADEPVDLPSGQTDRRFDVEVTSNRGDMLSHVGCAREIAAAPNASTPRTLKLPVSGPIARGGGPASDAMTLENTTPEVCPLFTAHVIKGVTVAPSPAWLVDLLESVGQRSINNVVDITNFITFELGNPCHVFDLSKLAGRTLRIRYAAEGEALTTLDGKARTLAATDLVVADAERPQSLAGVIGGQDSEVDGSTTDIVFEMATWDPVTIRRPARRMSIRTDAGYRFERIVDPRTIAAAAERAVALIQELAGGQVCEGVLSEGKPLLATSPITLRPERCAKLLGIEIPADEVATRLRRLEIDVEPMPGGTLTCTPPPFRPDLEREVDLIEELARVKGYDQIPLAEKLAIRVRHPQESERNRQKISSTLTGLGFYETVTFSFVSPKAAQPAVPEGLSMVSVDDDRRGAEPTLRPSVVPSLLACRRANQDARNDLPGGIRLFELSAVFAEKPSNDAGPGETVENLNLTLLMDVEGVKPGKKAKPEQLQAGLRAMRGAIDAVLAAVGLEGLEVEAIDPPVTTYHPGAVASLKLAGRVLGLFGLVADDRATEAGLDRPVVAAELDARLLLDAAPPIKRVTLLPEFPGIERDVSVDVDDPVAWAAITEVVDRVAPRLEHFEGCSFVGTFRGEQVGKGRKSVTMRLRFRAEGRTLRHDEVDPAIDTLIPALAEGVGATIRG